MRARAQRDLSVSYNRIADVLLQHRNSAAALKAYQDALVIRERLAKADPFNTQAQRDLSISYTNVGDVLLQQGNAPAALKAYQDALAIRWPRLTSPVRRRSATWLSVITDSPEPLWRQMTRLAQSNSLRLAGPFWLPCSRGWGIIPNIRVIWRKFGDFWHN